MKTTPDMVLFWDGIYSNWYPCKIKLEGITYNCVEQYMMSQKAQLFGDQETLIKIMETSSPSKQKALGRKVKGFDAKAWESIAKDVVYEACFTKFADDPQLKADLLATNNREIVEASPHDRLWGIGLGEDDPKALDKSQWLGKNWLGEVLMKVRKDLR